ncbi:demethoxyubiquinone hydroxylase family protein [Deltaproteobacteria bacterium OttesenSCG-928-M10]|nr:demethoxyubiquinone hydroxylase family protein [Deltaproteobacteria bacterium OttesenSCG-928-M10]
MPSFPNPFAGNVDRKITKAELIQALRIDIAGELEAIFLYDAHVMATDDPVVKKVLADIRDEEKAHVGELTALMRYLDPMTTEHLLSGENEVKEMMEELGIQEPDILGPASGPTVGSLKDE